MFTTPRITEHASLRLFEMEMSTSLRLIRLIFEILYGQTDRVTD